MRPIYLLAVLLLSLTLQSCQCANKPPIGPVEQNEDRDEQDD